MIIRQASGSDIGLLVNVIRSSFRDVAERFNLTVKNCPKNLAFCTNQRVKDDFERGLRYCILEQNDKACGCVALEEAGPDFCYLGRLAVLPGYRRKGLGAALVNHVFEQAKKIGMQRVEIGIIDKDTKLKSWYKKFGFVQKSTKRFKHLPFLVAFMYKELR